MSQAFKNDNLVPLFEAVSLKCQQLQQAIRVGDDHLVRLLDRELEPLIAAVVDYRAHSEREVQQQLRFIGNLIREDADDRSCVLRHSAMLSVLIDRYFGCDEHRVTAPAATRVRPSDLPGDDVFLNETILNSLPDRVAVVTTDYRYLYSNPLHSRFYGRQPLDIIGRHVAELVGADFFEEVARDRLDRCFLGATLDFDGMLQSMRGGGGRVRCRMSPLAAPHGRIIGALIVMQDMPQGAGGPQGSGAPSA